MQDTPLISIALCTYNGERFLREQLDSLLAQDYQNVEIVAVDDASTDGTLAILQGYAARDPRIRVFRNASNLGFHGNFQEAMARCRGDLVAPSDQDDVWRPDKLSLLLAALGDRAAAYCDSELVDEDGQPLGQKMSRRLVMGSIDDPANLLIMNCVSGHAMLFRRSILDRALPIPEGLYHDWWIAFVSAGAGGIAYHPEPLVAYRQHGRTVTDIAGLRLVRRSRRPRGHRLMEFDADERRLRAFAEYASQGADLFAEKLFRLWEGWRGQLLCPRLALFVLLHRHRLYRFQRDVRNRRARNALKLLWGLRLKRLFDGHAYGAPSPDAGPARPPAGGG